VSRSADARSKYGLAMLLGWHYIQGSEWGVYCRRTNILNSGTTHVRRMDRNWYGIMQNVIYTIRDHTRWTKSSQSHHEYTPASSARRPCASAASTDATRPCDAATSRSSAPREDSACSARAVACPNASSTSASRDLAASVGQGHIVIHGIDIHRIVIDHVPPYIVPVLVTGAKAEAWCLPIHADASLSLGRCSPRHPPHSVLRRHLSQQTRV